MGVIGHVMLSLSTVFSHKSSDVKMLLNQACKFLTILGQLKLQIMLQSFFFLLQTNPCCATFFVCNILLIQLLLKMRNK